MRGIPRPGGDPNISTASSASYAVLVVVVTLAVAVSVITLRELSNGESLVSSHQSQVERSGSSSDHALVIHGIDNPDSPTSSSAGSGHREPAVSSLARAREHFGYWFMKVPLPPNFHYVPAQVVSAPHMPALRKRSLCDSAYDARYVAATWSTFRQLAPAPLTCYYPPYAVDARYRWCDTSGQSSDPSSPSPLPTSAIGLIFQTRCLATVDELYPPSHQAAAGLRVAILTPPSVSDVPDTSSPPFVPKLRVHIAVGAPRLIPPNVSTPEPLPPGTCAKERVSIKYQHAAYKMRDVHVPWANGTGRGDITDSNAFWRAFRLPPFSPSEVMTPTHAVRGVSADVMRESLNDCDSIIRADVVMVSEYDAVGGGLWHPLASAYAIEQTIAAAGVGDRFPGDPADWDATFDGCCSGSTCPPTSSAPLPNPRDLLTPGRCAKEGAEACTVATLPCVIILARTIGGAGVVPELLRPFCRVVVSPAALFAPGCVIQSNASTAAARRGDRKCLLPNRVIVSAVPWATPLWGGFFPSQQKYFPDPLFSNAGCGPSTAAAAMVRVPKATPPEENINITSGNPPPAVSGGGGKHITPPSPEPSPRGLLQTTPEAAMTHAAGLIRRASPDRPDDAGVLFASHHFAIPIPNVFDSTFTATAWAVRDSPLAPPGTERDTPGYLEVSDKYTAFVSKHGFLQAVPPYDEPADADEYDWGRKVKRRPEIHFPPQDERYQLLNRYIHRILAHCNESDLRHHLRDPSMPLPPKGKGDDAYGPNVVGDLDVLWVARKDTTSPRNFDAATHDGLVAAFAAATHPTTGAPLRVHVEYGFHRGVPLVLQACAVRRLRPMILFGAHGSSLAAALWLRPPCAVVEVLPQERVQGGPAPFMSFRTLANMRGCRYYGFGAQSAPIDLTVSTWRVSGPIITNPVGAVDVVRTAIAALASDTDPSTPYLW